MLNPKFRTAQQVLSRAGAQALAAQQPLVYPTPSILSLNPSTLNPPNLKPTPSPHNPSPRTPNPNPETLNSSSLNRAQAHATHPVLLQQLNPEF